MKSRMRFWISLCGVKWCQNMVYYFRLLPQINIGFRNFWWAHTVVAGHGTSNHLSSFVHSTGQGYTGKTSGIHFLFPIVYHWTLENSHIQKWRHAICRRIHFPKAPLTVSGISYLPTDPKASQKSANSMSRFSICQVKGFFFSRHFWGVSKNRGGVVTKMDGLLVISGKTFIKMGWGLGGTIIFRKHYHMLLNWISWEG